MNRKADIKMIMGALKEQRRLSPRTIKRIEAGLKKFFGRRKKT